MKVQKIDFTGFRFLDVELQSKIGEGGSGSVWMGHQSGEGKSALHRRVAVKILGSLHGDPFEGERSSREFVKDLDPLIELSSQIGIVRYYSTFSANVPFTPNLKVTPSIEDGDGVPYLSMQCYFIVMEYADGGALGSTYRDKHVLSNEKRYLDHFIDLAKSLDLAHQKALVHCDIKPDNVLWFTESDILKISDFGIAFDASKEHEGKVLRGTLAYMAPETFTATDRPSFFRDIYAFGATLYETICGVPAFSLLRPLKTDEDIREHFLQIHSDECNRPSAKAHAHDIISFRLNEMIKRMLSVDPAERPLLGEVRECLEKEKASDRTAVALSVPDADLLPPPTAPEWGALNLLHPRFREALEEKLYFILIENSTFSALKISRLFNLLHGYFGLAFSVFELYGKYDFVVRVWAKDDGKEIELFCAELADRVLNEDRNAISVFSSDSVQYFNQKSLKTLAKWNSVERELEDINIAQQGDTQDSAVKNARRRLDNRGVYLRAVKPFDPSKKIKCFMLIKSRTAKNFSEREAHYALILSKLSESEELSNNKYRMSSCASSAPYSGRFNPVEADYVFSFVAPDYGKTDIVPRIVSGIENLRLSTTTLLSTGSYFRFSDGVSIV